MKKGQKSLEKKVLSKLRSTHKCGIGVFVGKKQKLGTVVINGVEFEADVPDTLRKELLQCD